MECGPKPTVRSAYLPSPRRPSRTCLPMPLQMFSRMSDCTWPYFTFTKPPGTSIDPVSTSTAATAKDAPTAHLVWSSGRPHCKATVPAAPR